MTLPSPKIMLILIVIASSHICPDRRRTFATYKSIVVTRTYTLIILEKIIVDFRNE